MRRNPMIDQHDKCRRLFSEKSESIESVRLIASKFQEQEDIDVRGRDGRTTVAIGRHQQGVTMTRYFRVPAQIALLACIFFGLTAVSTKAQAQTPASWTQI